ncbi:MAG TPA: hypothetical protein VJ546_05105 [Bacillales bacterium]|nr:hypothetical protein [Bacillales bacterium]
MQMIFIQIKVVGIFNELFLTIHILTNYHRNMEIKISTGNLDAELSTGNFRVQMDQLTNVVKVGVSIRKCKARFTAKCKLQAKVTC